MKRIIRLTERDLTRIVKRVIMEHSSNFHFCKKLPSTNEFQEVSKDEAETTPGVFISNKPCTTGKLGSGMSRILVHNVKKGETLDGILKYYSGPKALVNPISFDITPKVVAEINGITPDVILSIGKKIIIPEKLPS